MMPSEYLNIHGACWPERQSQCEGGWQRRNSPKSVSSEQSGNVQGDKTFSNSFNLRKKKIPRTIYFKSVQKLNCQKLKEQ